MDDIVSSPPSPVSRKRAAPEDDTSHEKLLNLKGNQFVMPTPPDTDNSNDGSPENARIKSRAASPAASSSGLSTIESVSNTGTEQDLPAGAATGTPSSGQPPSKRRKLTPAEKLEQQQAREVKEREKAATKARKDEEKRLKDEEKRRKAEEREAKKREKELEDERKVQEKLKKERSQMRLGAFFQAKPTAQVQQADDGKETDSGRARRKSLSLEPYDAVADQIRDAASPAKGAKSSTPQRPSAPKPTSVVRPIPISDYRKMFLPFELPSHSRLASVPNMDRTAEEYEAAQSLFDRELEDPSIQEKFDLGLSDSYPGISHHFSADRHLRRGIPVLSMRQLIDRIQGTSSQPIDLTDETSSSDAMDLLQEMSVRHLHFSEDVRPAYHGTYTKISSPRRVSRLRRNPFSRVRTDTDYDYDSEAEWEEPEEGEDLLSDDEDDADDPADAEDIEGFLDDEEDALKNKRKLITGDLVPTNTGVCWEDSSGRLSASGQEGTSSSDLHEMRMDVLLPTLYGKTIDPFSKAYWDEEPSPLTQGDRTRESNHTATARLMAPPRPPLQQRTNTNTSIETQLIGAAEGEKGPIMSATGPQGAKRGRKPAPKTLSTEDLAEFKEAVVGSPLGKLDLLKGLKSRFPKITQETIKDTLGSHFAQVGNSRVEKKWVYVGPA